MNIQRADLIKERDSLLEHILYKIQESPVSRENLIIRGGAALHFFYSSPRYSSDIDAAIEEGGFDLYKNHIIKDLNKDICIDNKVYHPKLAKNNTDFFRISYNQDIPNTPNGKIEVDRISAPKKFKKSEGKYSPILVEDPSEIYADKVIATMHRMKMRGSMKPSDLFDMDYIVNVLKTKATKEEIRQKAKSYNDYGWEIQVLDNVLKYITDSKKFDEFRRVLEESMMPDFFETQKFDNAYFESKAEYFEEIKPLFERSLFE
ncbi:MAG: nucleotidyl transferase AbiEii/AbiGii toxin family protein [Candidatus Pacearchaeota archaeon]